MKQKPGSGAFYATQPRNGLGLYYSSRNLYVTDRKFLYQYLKLQQVDA